MKAKLKISERGNVENDEISEHTLQKELSRRVDDEADRAFATSEDAWNESLGSGTEIRLRLREETNGKIYPALIAKHDVMDWTCTRGWLNFPVGLSMEHEIYKSANTLRSKAGAVATSSGMTRDMTRPVKLLFQLEICSL